MLTQRDWKAGTFEIEPGETDYLHAEFFIPSTVEVVEFYFFLENPRKKAKNIGCTTTAILDVTQQEGKVIMATEQVRQQIKQPPQQPVQQPVHMPQPPANPSPVPAKEQ